MPPRAGVNVVSRRRDTSCSTIAPARRVRALCGASPSAFDERSADRDARDWTSRSSSGSPYGPPTTRAIARALPNARIIYGGVFTTYHWREILGEEPHVDAIVRGEGEETIRQLIAALETQSSLGNVRGIAYRENGWPVATAPAIVIRDLDAYRIGWELIDHRRYTYWGGLRAVVVQFSRGSPHICTYCGQRGFWTRWRHRDPVKFAVELARLYREHGVRVINFAD